MGNSILNVAGIFFVALFFIFYMFGLGMLSNLSTMTANTTEKLLNQAGIQNTTLYENTKQTYFDLEGLFESVSFLFVVLVLFAFYSSFLNTGSLQSYIINFIGGAFISGILLYFIAYFYNEVISVSILDFSSNDVFVWFFQNISTIFLLNIAAATLSFVFITSKKGEGI